MTCAQGTRTQHGAQVGTCNSDYNDEIHGKVEMRNMKNVTLKENKARREEKQRAEDNGSKGWG